MLTLCYVIHYISTNECEGEPLRCPTVPTTPSRPCEVVPTSRTLADTEHIISKTAPQKCLLCAMLYGAFLQMNARVNPYAVPWFQRHHPDHVRLCQTSRTPRHKKYIISKIGPSKMLTLYYVIRRNSTNECAREPLRCPTVPTTPSRPCEVVPTSRTLADTEHIISKTRPQKC